MTKHLPNFITSLNILCGCIAILFAVSGDLATAAFFVFLGIFLDFFDGLAARLLKAQSEVGLQLDSLADVITSGVVPGIVMFQLLNEALFGTTKTMAETFSGEIWNEGFEHFVPLIGLLITVASAYRLAKFNVDERQTSDFFGLPTPANALWILSLPLILIYQPSEMAESIILNPWFLIGLTLLSCYLLNAEIRLFALKFKTWDFAGNKIRYIFLGLCAVLFVTLKFMAIPFIIVLYVLLSLIGKKQKTASL